VVVVRVVHLINDDQPSTFTPRRLEVVRSDVRLGDKPALIVAITPAIEQLPGGPLETALLVARRVGVDVDSLRRGEPAKPERVFVCRLEAEVTDENQVLAPDAVSIVFWGLVTD
jgi:hypothetical protein